MAKDRTRGRKKKRNSPKSSDEEIAAAADSGDKGFHLGGSIRSDEYAVAVLRGVIEFRSRTGGAPTASTTGAFFESIKDSLPPTVTQDQLCRKVCRLWKKYNKVDKDCDAGEDVPYHELLREAWGNDEKKAKVDNFGATEEKNTKIEQSAFSTQKTKKAKVQPSGTDGKLQVKEVQWKGKDKIGKKRPSRTTSKKSKVKKLPPVATRGSVSGPIPKFWQDDYSDKEAPSYAGKDEKDWDTDDWFEDFGIISEDQLLRSTYTCLNRVLIDQERATQAILQVRQFHARFGSMGTQSALRAAQSADPVEWWYAFGLDVPELREAAVRILCQTTSSSGCERNWSTFDLIHTKRRNRLQNKRLNDLVFVHYNSRLQERNKRTHRKIMNMDPINLSTFFIDDPLEDWLQEEQPIDLNQEDVDTILSREENIEAEENIDNNPPPPPPEESIDIPSGYNDNAYVPSSWNVPEVDEQDFVPEAFYNYDFTQFSLDENMNFQLPTSHGYVDTGGSGGRYGGPFGGQDGIPHGHRSGGSSSFGGESSSGYAGGSSGDGRGTGGGDGSDTWFSGGYNYPTGWEQQH